MSQRADSLTSFSGYTQSQTPDDPKKTPYVDTGSPSRFSGDGVFLVTLTSLSKGTSTQLPLSLDCALFVSNGLCAISLSFSVQRKLIEPLK